MRLGGTAVLDLRSRLATASDSYQRDRDKYFDSTWTEVGVALEDGPEVSVSLSPSFWRTCSELRSADLGRWLLGNGAAPWPAGKPPGIAVSHEQGNRFSARILRPKQ